MADGDDEKSDKKDVGNGEIPQSNGIEPIEDDPSDVASIEDDCVQEYMALDQTIDHLNSVLNSMEEKNDDLYARALALIQDNKAVHEQLLQDRNQSTNSEETEKS
ncbi:hypothetical protein LOTGIDRAFT_172998 [Lottia gigantea]|uniref:Uncharacterized protein n=1 Tax=Lottia gigantea TaxID=225164 RepID=V4CFU2_LOTGI|nr:hypothetical protein LOTGIDRAFT_172998 [Lottia gigantea]ESP00900.1 hypothetical protein LOTGIDRAFT_172998 [Lottia gigantea]